ncbi:LysR substrate-binding domain-containing protein [Comamonadaceae bacterium M7527]|nr:LysR substrate-binding domain-containing protein [Comamonadaceae bacterium M7527]
MLNWHFFKGSLVDFKQLMYFERVAELGSFTKASDALGVAQPALSRQVRALEVELHQTLLMRNGRGAALTEAGELLLEHARGILYQVERAKQAVSDVRGTLSGRVVLGMPPSVARSLAIPLLRAFRAELPHAQLRITEGLTRGMQAQLLDGVVDVALLYNATPAQAPGIDAELLCHEALVLVQANTKVNTKANNKAKVASKTAGESDRLAMAASIDLRDIADLPLLIPSRPNALRMQLEAELMKLGLAPRIALEVDGVSAILDLVADGTGAAVLARHAVTSSDKAKAYAVRAIHVGGRGAKPGGGVRTGVPMSVAVYVATSHNRPVTPTQQAAMVLLRTVVAQVLGRG